MPDRFVSALATGGGDGTSASPYTLAEGIAAINTNTLSVGETLWIKNDSTYTISTIAITATGNVFAHKRFKGYNTATDDTGRATIVRTSTAASVFVDFNGSSYWNIEQIVFDSNSKGTSCLRLTTYIIAINCEIKNATQYGVTGISGATEGTCINCHSHHNTYSGFGAGLRCINCYSELNLQDGFYGTTGFNVNCIARANSNNGFYYTDRSYQVNCIADANLYDGFDLAAAHVLINSDIGNSRAGYYAIDNTSALCGFISNVNFWNCATNSRTIAGVRTYYALTSQYVETGSGDYTRNGTNLDGLGLATIGGKSYDYNMNIGPYVATVTTSVAATFSGITQLEAVGGGCLLAKWNTGTGTIATYNIYVRSGTNAIFNSSYLLAKADSNTTEFIFRTEADNTTFLSSVNQYYVGVKAENAAGEDTNTSVLNISIEGDGHTYLKMSDIVVIG